MAPWLLLLLGVIGALDALYFIAVTYRWLAPDSRIIPAFCRMDEGSCSSIVDTKWARVFGLPNSVYGFVWYLLVAGVAVYAMMGHPLPWCLPLLVASALTVAVSVLLFWSLIWKLKTRCPLCFLGHATNLSIFAVLLWMCAF